MQVFEKKEAIIQAIDQLKAEGKRIGFVPTMGALHEGHVSLIKRSVKENDITVASIFVNPTQFNDKNDLANYPRTFEKDIAMLENAGCSLVFYPNEKEMYPEPDTRIFQFGYIEQVMEGAHRPGHFNGVAQIVSKLFDIVKPHNAYFGQKDFQQLAIIKQLVKNLKLPINIVPCEIIREPDGLAMSSRNTLLSVEERKNAVAISKALFKAQTLVGQYSVEEIKKQVIDEINSNPYLQVEYFDIVDDTELTTVQTWNNNKTLIGCVAVKCGKIRLIDNVKF